MNGTELRAVGLGLELGGTTILDEVEVVLRSGEMVVVRGASGSGKTLLAYLLSGLLEPDRGTVLLNGQALPDLRDPAARPALVPQTFALVPTLTAAETVSLPLQVRGLDREEIRGRATYWLEATGLDSCANRLVDELSGGQRQRVAIARAMATEAPVIILDEPTAELDPVNRDLVLSLLRDKRRGGVVLVAVSHDVDVATAADRVIELPDRRRHAVKVPNTR